MEATKIKEIISNTQKTARELEPKPVIKCLLSFIGGLLMMNPFVVGEMSPFSISLTAALHDACALWAGAGGIVGAFLFFDGIKAVKYVAIIMMCILIKGLAARLLSNKLREISVYINAFASPFIVGSATMLATGFKADEFLGILFESALTCSGAYIFQLAAYTLWNKKEISRCTTFEISSVIITFGIMLMHFYRYQLFNISPVIMIFAACILLSSSVKNGSGGALCGICLSFTVGLSGETGFICLGLCLGGLLCGELVRKARHWGALGFILPVCISAIADGSIPAYMAIVECSIVSGLYLIVPEKIFTELSEKINAPVPVYVKNDSSQEIVRKLNSVSTAINRVSDCITAIQRTFTEKPDVQLNSAIRCAWSNVCAECELLESCRSEIKNPTDETVERLATALKNNAKLDETRFPKGFSASCYCFSEMQTEIQKRYIDFSANQGVQGQVKQIREMMSEQFQNMADILRSLACEFDEEIKINLKTADICAADAKEFGLDVISADSFIDKFGRIFISLNVTVPARDFNVSKLTDSLSNAIGTTLDIPELEESDNSATLKFSQKIAYSVSIGAFSRPTENESVCGDYFRSFRDENGRYIIILSDGMGTGSHAAVDSAMASELFSNLIKSGLSFDCTLAIVNSALLVKSDIESLATLDILCIDLYTGKADFLKAGAAATFIKRKGNVIRLEQPSMPLGILNDVDFSKANAALQSGDIIVMVSDGVLGDNNGWIQQELKLWNSGDNSPQALAQMIVDSACERKASKHRDDMTAVAVYIE